VTISHPGARLDAVAAVAVAGGAALYLATHVAFLYRATSYLFRRRTIGAAALLALIPFARVIPALASLALVAFVCAGVAAAEAIGWRGHRLQVRHPERAH
jgi:low temperature requirement protein LtrA